MLVGIELDDAHVTAVAVTDEGTRLSRAQVAVAKGIGAAALTALELLGPGVDGAGLGAAAASPDAEAIAAASTTIRKKYPSMHNAIVSTGTAAAFAESWIGAAKGTEHVVLFAVGDHSHGGVVRAGLPVVGAHGRAGAVSWMSLNPVEREDYRKSGCVEAEVAASGIVRRLIWRIKAGDRSRVQDTVKDDLSAITVGHVLNAARAGDGVSISVMRDTAKYLGMAAANLVAIADPQALVLGGLMADAADLLFEPVRVEVGRRLPRAMVESLTIVPAGLGDDAPAIGAARFATLSRP